MAEEDSGMSLTKARIAEIEARLNPLRECEERAKYLQPLVPLSYLFVGVAGTNYSGESFEVLPGFLTLRPVTNPPGIVHVCGAADLRHTDYLAVARYSHHIVAELAVGDRKREGHDAPEFLRDLAWHTAVLLKLRGHDLLTCPASSTVSWDTVAAVADQTVQFSILDDVPRQIQTDDVSSLLAQPDLLWVRENWNRALALRDASNSRRFGLAFNLAYVWNHTSEPRVAIANLWCALDALFGLRTDRPVTDKLVERIVAWLPDVPECEVRELYLCRCDAVHGRWMKSDELQVIIRKTKSLLVRSLVRCIEEDAKTLPDCPGS